MYNWKITFYMKNGQTIKGIYHGEERNSDSVARKLLVGTDNTFCGCRGENDDSNLLVKIGEIAAADISVYQKKKENKK